MDSKYINTEVGGPNHITKEKHKLHIDLRISPLDSKLKVTIDKIRN